MLVRIKHLVVSVSGHTGRTQWLAGAGESGRLNRQLLARLTGNKSLRWDRGLVDTLGGCISAICASTPLGERRMSDENYSVPSIVSYISPAISGGGTRPLSISFRLFRCHTVISPRWRETHLKMSVAEIALP